MLPSARPILPVLGFGFAVALGAGALGLVVSSVPLAAPALAQGAAAPVDQDVKQVALTQKQIDSLLAAAPEIAAVEQKAQAGQSDQPNPKVQTQLDAIAKKHGFADLAAYGEAADSVSVVLAGMDPDTKTYVGAAALIKKQMAQVQADKSLPPKDKAQALNEMKEALASSGGVKALPGNVDLVAKNYEKLAEAFQSAE